MLRYRRIVFYYNLASTFKQIFVKCSQNQFVCNIYINPVCLFYAIFCLMDFSSYPFNFSSFKQDTEVAPSGL